jgi:dolichol-phosphate mannosyltransferase
LLEHAQAEGCRKASCVMEATPTLLVGLATYNELENLPSLVAAIHTVLPDAQVLVVDDNSPDGTGRWCDEFGTGNPWFSCIHRPGKEGLGTALALLMRTAVEQGVDLLITLDADWSHPADSLPHLVAQAKSTDVVVGSRYCPGGKIVGWPWHRRLASRVLNGTSRLVLGLSVRDCSGNLRAYRTERLATLPWDRLQTVGYAFIEEVLWHLKQAGATFAEVPITFTDRTSGQSKLTWREAVGAGRMLARMAWRRLRSRP